MVTGGADPESLVNNRDALIEAIQRVTKRDDIVFGETKCVNIWR